MSNSRRAFTLTEILIGLIILSALAVMTLNTKVSNQTAEREAERVVNFLEKFTNRANKFHLAFSFVVINSEFIKIRWEINKSRLNAADQFDDSLQATPGCKFKLEKISSKSSEEFRYNLHNNFSPSGSIKITGSDGSSRYIIFSPAGRIRIAKFDDNE